MKKAVSAVFALLLVVALSAACSKKDEGTSATTTTTTTTTTTGPMGVEKIGVVECDLYIEKLGNCLNTKVPDMAKGALKTSFEQAIKGWKQAAVTPEGKAGLANACKMANDSAKQMVAAYGCEM